MSATSNALAELPTQTNYQKKICCSAPVPLGSDCGAAGAVPFLDLYVPTNSHAEEATGSIHEYSACISGMQIGCGYGANCDTVHPPAGSATCLASISASTNAHIGDCSAYPALKVCCWLDDITPPQAWLQPLPAWKNASADGTVSFPVSWRGTDASSPSGSGIHYFIQYAVFDQAGTPVLAWTDWNNTYGNYTQSFGPASPIIPANYNGKSIAFRVNATDQSENTLAYKASAPWENTTIDTYNPVLNSWITDSSGSIIQPGYLDPSKTTYVSITSNASDNISGISSNVIYLTVVQKNLPNYMFISSSPSDCAGGSWSTPPYGGNRTCTVKVDYADGTVITYDITATDRAGNTNSTSGVVTTHILTNFLVHLTILSIGTSVDIPVQVRNLETTTQNLTLRLEGFGIAAFVPASGLAALTPCKGQGRCANITLSPGEQKTIYVRIIANDVTSAPEMLNLAAVSSSGVLDNDTALIIVGYPADFPAFDAWWAVLLMMMFAGVVFYRVELSA